MQTDGRMRHPSFQEKKKMTVFENLKAVLDEATARVTLSATDEKAKARLKEAYTFQEETFFGAVLTKTGGIVIDGRIRIYGPGRMIFTGEMSLCPNGMQ